MIPDTGADQRREARRHANRTRKAQGRAHPLHGADPITLLRATRRGGGPDRHRLGAFAGILGASLGRLPITLAERAVMAVRLPAVRRQMAPPVFIIGHWRSGTTHLYNVMTTAGGFGYVPPLATGLPWELFSIAAALRPWLERQLPEDRLIDRVPVTPESPQEDEIGVANMTDVSFYHGLYFPRHAPSIINRGLFFDGCDQNEIRRWERAVQHFLAKISLHQGHTPLLIKNPVYTSRVAMLARLYPGARFIFLHRNPFDVFLSMRNFYRKLLPWLALQAFADLDIDRLILDVYGRMMEEYHEQAATLPPGQLLEVGYDQLDQQPMETLARIYADLDLPGFDQGQQAFGRYLDSQQSYRRNDFKGSAEDVALVHDAWGRWIDHWGYPVPEPRDR